jgi:hypothetical protein
MVVVRQESSAEDSLSAIYAQADSDSADSDSASLSARRLTRVLTLTFYRNAFMLT